MRLHVKLRDGFRHNTVTIRVNGEEVYRRSDLTTDLTISVADVVEIPVEESRIQLQVAVEGGPATTKDLHVRETPYVEIRIIDGSMELRASAEETPML